MACIAMRVVCSDDEQYRLTVVPGSVSYPEQHGHHAGHVEALLAAGQPAAQREVVDLGGVELGHLGQRGPDHLHREVVGPDGGERALERAADGRTCRGDDDCFRHRLPSSQDVLRLYARAPAQGRDCRWPVPQFGHGQLE
jgi:fermentation-respiration switch protein FrsA (DUF1100 family)